MASVRRDQAANLLGKSGIIQTGDVILTLRPEWAYRGAYPDMMMGISHAGMAFVHEGRVYNLDHPLVRGTYMGNFDSKHYRQARYVYILRMKGMSRKQRENLLGWSRRIYERSEDMTGPSQMGKIAFNPEYAKPLYPESPDFPQSMGRIILGDDKAPGVSIFCAEFVWAMLALRDCDPVADAKSFMSGSAPKCIKTPFEPMHLLGDYFTPGGHGQPGFVEGPLLAMRSMRLPEAELQAMIHQVFSKERPRDMDSESRYDEGPIYDALEDYYNGVAAGTPVAAKMREQYNSNTSVNYPPTAFLVNTMLPPTNPDRVLDIVGMLAFANGLDSITPDNNTESARKPAQRGGTQAGKTAPASPQAHHGFVR